MLFIKKTEVNEQEKKLFSVEVLFKDFSYSTFLHFICPLTQFSLQLLYHQSSPSHLGFILLHFSKKNKKEFDTFYYIPFIFVVVILLLVWFCFAPVLLKKNIYIVKNEIFQFLIFVVVFCVIILQSQFYFAPLHKKEKKKKKKKELRIFSLSPLLSFTIATILDLQSQRSRRENC